ncbi:hypothetical protein FIBSPDRAFT_100323 [Athelia psychrophila]|uniref:Uncharacterized protein n=1 Tax=Athelia psychrophila TaxID=1759441 RepID=A0A166DIX9_9AGAM|nr:hypothetical protein FIBSPDRAFT_100323 [Fibularhizoctonia sp. CBS 109695]
MASIDGIFALLFGRTIAAIIFGTRIVSPFGLLGVVTHDRFKLKIKKQFPYMQEDIDRRGMAAYISEVAIDSALIDALSTTEHTTSATRTRTRDTEEGGDSVQTRRRQTGSSASHLGLPSAGEELGDRQDIPLLDRRTNN